MHRKLFSLFLLFLPSQLAIHFWPDFAFVSGLRIDYLSPTVYFTDILFVLFFSIWFIQSKKYGAIRTISGSSLLVIVVIVVNILLSLSMLSTLLHWLRILQIVLLVWYIRANHYNGKQVLSPLSVGLLFSAALALRQFGTGRNIGGILYWLGERPLSIFQPGTALVSLAGQSFLRPYATFPHPNALAGFAGTILLLALPLWKRTYYKLVSVVAVTIIVLAFSQAAILGLTLSLLFRFSKVQPPLWMVIVATILITFAMPFLPIALTNDTSVIQRMELAAMGMHALLVYPLFGTGLGQFIRLIPTVTNTPVLWIQPIHNIPLGLLVEMGIVGTASAIILFRKQLQKIKYLSVINYSLFIFILTTSLFDHYWLTAHQNRLLLAIIIGVTISKKVVTIKTTNNKNA